MKESERENIDVNERARAKIGIMKGRLNEWWNKRENEIKDKLNNNCKKNEKENDNSKLKPEFRDVNQE